MRPVHVEHIGIAAYSRPKVGECSRFPLIVEGGVVNADETHICHSARRDILKYKNQHWLRRK